ncbi:hypothetical protein HK102_011095 [Quaeritorhiza haematococci]|nr:hypothetical protein HK102_011095 [Quaeritorhiza haematococci]
MIIEEATKFFQEWDFQKNDAFEIFPQVAELTIRTASTCLMGREIREQLHKDVTKLYHDLDGGFTPLNVFVEWLPLPSFYRRDRANRIMTSVFKKIIDNRRAAAAKEEASGTQQKEEVYDVLQSLMTSKYKDGSSMSDEAVAHMMIALLMAGQHTSSTTSTWSLFRLADNPDVA